MNKKCDIIVVDPPWDIKKIRHRVRPNQVSMDYATMSVDKISQMDISKISNDNSWLFLWSTQKFLWSARDIISKWGFNYKFLMVWEKTYGISAGMPLYGFRWNAEFVLVGSKGKKDAYPKTKLIPMVFQAENIRHSQKPDKFYELIESLGNSRIDVFARKVRNGWDAWGAMR